MTANVTPLRNSAEPQAHTGALLSPRFESVLQAREAIGRLDGERAGFVSGCRFGMIVGCFWGTIVTALIVAVLR
jgi:predicted ABC-type sugar transport system permease subunit